MPFYLSEYIGSGTKVDPFRAVGQEEPGASSIDLRPDSSLLDGGGLNAALLWTPSSFVDARARFLADDKLESLTQQQKNFLTNKLGVDLSSPTLLRDIVATLLTSPPGNGWKALKPGLLRWEIWLGGLLWEVPRISGGASDNFNRANETPLAAPWIESPSTSGQFNLVSNAVVGNGDDASYHYQGAATTEEQYSQISTAAGSVTSTSAGGPCVRMSTTGTLDAYEYDNFTNTSAGEILKWDGGASTSMIAGSIPRALPLRIEAEGSSIRIYANGVLSATTTDTAVNAGGQPGMFWYHTSSFDDWEGGDLGAQPTFRGSPRRGLMAVS